MFRRLLPTTSQSVDRTAPATVGTNVCYNSKKEVSGMGIHHSRLVGNREDVVRLGGQRNEDKPAVVLVDPTATKAQQSGNLMLETKNWANPEGNFDCNVMMMLGAKKSDENNRSFKKKRQISQCNTAMNVSIFSIGEQKKGVPLEESTGKIVLDRQCSNNSPTPIKSKVSAFKEVQPCTYPHEGVGSSNDNQSNGNTYQLQCYLHSDSSNIENEAKPVPEGSKYKVSTVTVCSSSNSSDHKRIDEQTTFMMNKEDPSVVQLGEEVVASRLLSDCPMDKTGEDERRCAEQIVPVVLSSFPQYWSRREKMKNAPCLANDI